MGKINLLSFEVANLIAAGEVVDRPSSAVKELLENAVDSGASQITLEIQRGGVSFIRVTDNGCGMEKDDLVPAITRHSTSKIHTAADLDAILTLGFRGEALAAIASVSRLRIFSKIPGTLMGALLTAEGGEVKLVSDIGCADGTTVIAEDLFYNVPARRKFLKKDSTEGTAIGAVVEKIALSHPDISFKFISDGEIRFLTSGSGDLRETIWALFGKDTARRALPADRTENGIRVHGFVSESDMYRSNRNMENFFINGRYVRSKTASAALEQAYASKIPADKFPFCVLNIELNPAAVDVNVHPAKLEVKFADERRIFDAVYYAVLSALDREANRPAFPLPHPQDGQELPHPQDGQELPQAQDGQDGQIAQVGVPDGRGPDSAEKPGGDKPVPPTPGAPPTPGQHLPSQHLPSQRKNPAADPRNAFLPVDRKQPRPDQVRLPSPGSYLPPSPNGGKTPSSADELAAARRAAAENIRGAADAFAAHAAGTPSDSGERTAEDSGTSAVPAGSGDPYAAYDRDIAPGDIPDYLLVGEVFNTYLIVQLEDRILMVDKHAAHERILFDELCRKSRRHFREKAPLSGQLLMTPLFADLYAAEADAAEEYRDRFEALGYVFSIEKTGVSARKASITQIPEELDQNEALELFHVLATRLSDATGTVESAAQGFFESRLWQASCKAAVKGGRRYDAAHMKWICDRLLQKPDERGSVIRTCPHGRPVAFEIRKTAMDRQFGR